MCKRSRPDRFVKQSSTFIIRSNLVGGLLRDVWLGGFVVPDCGKVRSAEVVMQAAVIREVEPAPDCRLPGNHWAVVPDLVVRKLQTLI